MNSFIESTQSHVLGTRLNETLTQSSTNDRTEKVLCFFSLIISVKEVIFQK